MDAPGWVQAHTPSRDISQHEITRRHRWEQGTSQTLFQFECTQFKRGCTPVILEEESLAQSVHYPNGILFASSWFYM